jgi:hypothetical protein
MYFIYALEIICRALYRGALFMSGIQLVGTGSLLRNSSTQFIKIGSKKFLIVLLAIQQCGWASLSHP